MKISHLGVDWELRHWRTLGGAERRSSGLKSSNHWRKQTRLNPKNLDWVSFNLWKIIELMPQQTRNLYDYDWEASSQVAEQLAHYHEKEPP